MNEKENILLKEKMIVLNTNMVRIFSRMLDSYAKTTSKFDSFAVFLRLSGNPFVHALLFNSKDSRDKALNLLKKWKVENNILYPFFYKGEKVTQDMLNELLLNNGDFLSWEKYKDSY